MRKLVILRRMSQSIFFILFIYILWSTTYPLSGILPPETFFKLNPLIMFITSMSERLILDGIVFSILMIVFSIILGRFFCGWVCPFGTTIDMVGVLKNKHSAKKSTNKKLYLPKFFLLGTILFFAILGVQIAWVFDPMVIMARFVSLNLIPTVTLLLNNFFMIIIKIFRFYIPIYDFYHELKDSILGINIYYFSHSVIIFLFFLLIVSASLTLRRFWCRVVCPLGAIYALLAKKSFLKRKIDECSHCEKCISSCRMGAIREDLSYRSSECILCMDCIYDCPLHITRFKFNSFRINKTKNNFNNTDLRSGITRKNFLFLLVSSWLCFFGFRNRQRIEKYSLKDYVIRPPAALKEEEFLDRCIRCGNCMKVCITNGLQPVLFEAGLEGIWTPQLVPEIGYCEYNCTLCGNVCPTSAIPKLLVEKKKQIRLGLAKIDRTICLPWIDKKECIVCEEHCPTADKAIKLRKEYFKGKTVLKPYVIRSLCIGCGICQTKCPVRPQRAIKVYPIDADRT